MCIVLQLLDLGTKELSNDIANNKSNVCFKCMDRITQ